MYLFRTEEEKPSEQPKRMLVSIELDGSDERTHVRSESALEFRISPDEKWLAFLEYFHAYITPFVRTGNTIEIGLNSKSIPIAKVTRDAGEYLHWSGDSQKLHWALGPELYTRELKDAFSFLDGAPQKLPEPSAKGVQIGFQQTSDIPSVKVALVGARIITMRGDEVLEDGTIVIEGNRIAMVGTNSDVKVPTDAKVIDVSGKTIMPGLIDVHCDTKNRLPERPSFGVPVQQQQFAGVVRGEVDCSFISHALGITNFFQRIFIQYNQVGHQRKQSLNVDGHT